MKNMTLVVCLLLLVTTLVWDVGCSQSPQPSAPTPSASGQTPAPVQAQKPGSKIPDKLQWDISLWGSPRALTYPIEDWAKDMKEATGGRWEIRLQYGEVLSPAKDAVDGLKAGLYAGVLTTAMYHPGKTPLLTVGENSFMGPSSLEQIGEWSLAFAKHPAIIKELDSWNAMILFPTPPGQSNYMGKKPFKKVEDLNGMRVRIDPTGGAPLEPFGAVITNIPAPEIYTALERGMLDGVFAIWTYYFGSFKINELSKYATLGVDIKVTPIYVLVSKTAWNSLPPEWQKLASDWAATKAMPKFRQYQDVDDAKWLPIYQNTLEITTLPVTERAKLLEKAKPAWENWVKGMEAKGLPGRDVLNFAIAKRDEIMAKK